MIIAAAAMIDGLHATKNESATLSSTTNLVDSNSSFLSPSLISFGNSSKKCIANDIVVGGFR